MSPSPALQEDVPALIPAEVAEHLKTITPEEKAVLKEIAKQHKDFSNEDELLAALKEKSPSLHEKATKLHSFIKEKVDALGQEAQDFVKKARVPVDSNCSLFQVLADGRELHRQYLAGTKPSLEDLKAKAKAHIEAFNGLSDEAKTQFKAQFPLLSNAVSSKLQFLFKKNRSR